VDWQGFQTLSEGGHIVLEGIGCSAVQVAHHWHRRLLRTYPSAALLLLWVVHAVRSVLIRDPPLLLIATLTAQHFQEHD
jgi:hypothetical protein